MKKIKITIELDSDQYIVITNPDLGWKHILSKVKSILKIIYT